MKRIFFSIFAILMAAGSYGQQNSATPSDFGTYYVLKGQTIEVPVTITNNGTKAIRSFSYCIVTEGDSTAETTVSARNLAVNQSREYTISLSADGEARRYTKTFAITRVNGAANEAGQPNSTGSVITIMEKPVVTSLVEEFTGTWCGWCPIGMDAMDKVYEAYRDNAVLIAVHGGDVMESGDFSDIARLASGYPSAMVNRGEMIYPSEGELKGQISKDLRNRIAAASIEVSAQWTDTDKNAITIDTKTKFAFTDDNANYAIAYALTQDGMKGTGSSWAQNNALSGNASYADSHPFWYNASSKVTGLEFNHVGVAAWNIAKGVKGSVNPAVQAGVEQYYTYEANIASKRLIQDKSKLKVIAILIDQTTGAIVNAGQTTIDDEATGIEKREQRTEGNVQYFTLNGKKLTAPQRGINIVRKSDGTYEKIFVR